MLKEFKAFLSRGNVIDLAVAVIIGAAFGKIIDHARRGRADAADWTVLGKVDFSSLFIALDRSKAIPESLKTAKDAGIPVIAYGQFLNEVITFLIVALAVFVVVKQANRFKAPDAPAPATKECPFCVSAIPVKATRCPQCTSSAVSKPLDEALDALVVQRRRVVTEQRARLVDVRPRLRNVAGLLRRGVRSLRVTPSARSSPRNHLRQATPSRVAEVDHFVRRAGVVDRRAHARDDVVDEGVVAAGRAVAEDRDRLALEHQSRELVDGQVRALPRSVNGEESQRDETHAIQVAVDVTEQLAADLGAGVRADRLQHVVVLAPRHARVHAVDAARRGEDELRRADAARQFQQHAACRRRSRPDSRPDLRSTAGRRLVAARWTITS